MTALVEYLNELPINVRTEKIQPDKFIADIRDVKWHALSRVHHGQHQD